MKKKLVSLMLVVMVCMFSLVACGGGDDKGNDGNNGGGGDAANTPNGSSSGYTFEYKGTSISVNTAIEPVIEKIGEPSSKFEAPSCAGQGTDFIYTYSGFDERHRRHHHRVRRGGDAGGHHDWQHEGRSRSRLRHRLHREQRHDDLREGRHEIELPDQEQRRGLRTIHVECIELTYCS